MTVYCPHCSRPFAEATQAIIDAEVARLLREAEQTAVGLIRSHRAELGRIVELLLEKETVDGAEVYRIAGRPVYLPHLLIGLALTGLLTLLNYRGVRLSAIFQNWNGPGLTSSGRAIPSASCPTPASSSGKWPECWRAAACTTFRWRTPLLQA